MMLRRSCLVLGRRFQHTVPECGHAVLTNKSLISVEGPDAVKFLNGLVTYKMLPSFIKKNETTISTKEVDKSVLLDEFDISGLNWGSLKESIESKNLTINRNGIFTSILNSKGRIISDVFIYPYKYNELDGEPRYLIEINTDLLKSILNIFKFHKLKSKVSFKILDDFKIWYIYNDLKQDVLYNLQLKYFNEDSKFLKNPTNSMENSIKFLNDPNLFSENLNKENVLSFAFDDRCPDFGIKLITPSSIDNLDEIINESFLPLNQGLLKLSTLDKRRYLTGIAESPTELTPNKYLPLESCFEYMGGINFDKGCYTGQELTVRTYHTGIIRKRIVPIKLYDFDKDSNEIELNYNNEFEFELDDLENLEIYSNEIKSKTLSKSPFNKPSDKQTVRKPKSSGTLLKSSGSLGLALIRLEDFASDGKFYVESTDKKIGIKAFMPYWWPEE